MSDIKLITEDKIQIKQKTTFDDYEPLYHQLCRLINNNYNINNTIYNTNCPAFFNISLIYLILPLQFQEKEKLILDIFNNIKYRNLFNYSIESYLNDNEIKNILKKYNLNPDKLYKFNAYQKKILYSYFYEILYEVSIENHKSNYRNR